MMSLEGQPELYKKVEKEYGYFMQCGSRGNDGAYPYYVSENPSYPEIDKYLLANGAIPGEQIYIWVCW